MGTKSKKAQHCCVCKQPMDFTVKMQLAQMDDVCAGMISDVIKAASEIIRNGNIPVVTAGPQLPRKGLEQFIEESQKEAKLHE